MDDSPNPDDSSSISSRENDVFSFKESLIPLQEHKVAGITSLSFDGLLDPPLLLKEDLKEGCGGQLWPAGMILTKYMLKYHREDLAGKKVLEIGAGGGLVGLAVARGCPSITLKLYITDQMPMYELMKENIVLNHLDSKVEAAVYDWGTPMPDTITWEGDIHTDETNGQIIQTQDKSRRSKSRPDIILAADCVYFEPAFPLLRDTLVDLISPKSTTTQSSLAVSLPTTTKHQDENDNHNTICYFAFKKRRKADWRFIKMLGKVLNVEEITSESPDVEMCRREAIYLYRISRKKNTRLGTAKTVGLR